MNRNRMKATEPIADALPIEPTQEATTQENPFAQAAQELAALYNAGSLPEGFDLETACSDRAFAELLRAFEPLAAVRIYDAEQRAAQAEQTAKQRMTEQVTARNALPRPTKANAAVSATPDYMGMSQEAFRALENQFKSAARSGSRTKI